MFDLGERRYLKYRPRAIFITHLHPDHAFFVRGGQEEEIGSEAEIFVPEANNKKIKVCPAQVEINHCLISAIPVIHSLKVKSLAYLIEAGRKRVLYTGDMVWIEKKYHSKMNNLDLVITDGSFIRQGGMIRRDQKTGKIYGHAGIPNLIRLFSQFTSKIIFVHFGSWFYRLGAAEGRKRIHDLSQEHKVFAITGYDGMEIEL